MKLRVYNKTLDPNIWNENKTLKPAIRENLLKIAEDFYNSTDLQGEIHDILFIGSSTNYNWTPTSDMDLHVVIDIAEERINEEYARKFMDTLGFKWNTEHDIEIKGHPVEVYIQDIREPNSNAMLSRPGAAIYSIFDDKWIQEPVHEKLDIDGDKIRRKFQTIQEKVKKLVETNDIDTLKDLMKSIRNYRNTGLAKGGEFCTENLVFKALRKSGVLEKIKTTINGVYDQQVSLPEHGNFQPTTSTSKMNESTTKNYLVIGMINRELTIRALIDYEGSGNGNGISHWHVNPSDSMFATEESSAWRYKSKNNTIYWRMDVSPTEQQKDEVVAWLHDKYHVINPKQIMDNSIVGYIKNAHHVNESTDKYLIVGMINKNLEIISFKDLKGNYNHDVLLKQNPQFDYDKMSTIFWRYKSTNNTIYYQDDVNEQIEFVINEYLKTKYGVVNPKKASFGLGGHNID